MSQKRRGFVRLAALAAVGAGCLMATACGQGNSGGAAATASASGTPDPLAGLSASEIAAKAIVNLEAASSLTKAHAGSNADAAIQWANGRYIKTTTSGSMGGVTQLCDPSQTLGAVKLTAAMTKGNFTSIDGVRVLPLIQGSDGTLWVTDAAKPEVVKITVPKRPDGMTGADSTSGVLTFSLGAPITLTAPPASDVTEGSAAGSS